MAIPKRVAERIQSKLKAYQTVLLAQKARDVSEADTVTIVKDLLADVFGYDKYTELTSEFSIRGTFCDLAVKLDGKLVFLIEVKAIGLELKDTHIRQAVDYAANQGCEWVVLTNAVEWVLYHVIFKKPIDKQEIARINLLEINNRSVDDQEKLYLLTREGVTKSELAAYRDRRDATSRYMLAAIILKAESVQSAIRREVRRVSDILVDEEVIEKMLREQVLKREAIEGELAESASRRVLRCNDKKTRNPIEKEVQVGSPTISPIDDEEKAAKSA
ncbi:MAG: type I restriction enzyme HsdR N-terminal domain-containing protein [Planctomycetota bacterium]